jgi:hypothetical protein
MRHGLSFSGNAPYSLTTFRVRIPWIVYLSSRRLQAPSVGAVERDVSPQHYDPQRSSLDRSHRRSFTFAARRASLLGGKKISPRKGNAWQRASRPRSSHPARPRIRLSRTAQLHRRAHHTTVALSRQFPHHMRHYRPRRPLNRQKMVVTKRAELIQFRLRFRHSSNAPHPISRPVLANFQQIDVLLCSHTSPRCRRGEHPHQRDTGPPLE